MYTWKIDFEKKVGHPKIFTENEGIAFATHILSLSKFGFPVDELDFRFIVKVYLTNQSQIVIQ
jgi:hypothetical protein